VAKGDFYGGAFGSVYSTYMERPWLSRLVGRVVWGGDTRRYYESMAAVTTVPDGGTVVDCPCGAGPAFRALSPQRDVRYLAVDVSTAMLERARRRAKARGLGQVEFLEASATALPLESSSVDLFLSYWGLHVYEDPRAAVGEWARVLKPGGRLVGAAIVPGRDSLRQRLIVQPGRGDFGPLAEASEVEAWLAEEGFGVDRVERSGPLLYFEATA
jgi:SAM-dependent methyltransferase